MGQSYRAAYWVSEDRQADVVLTGPEHATLSDDDLLAEARAEAERVGLDTSQGTIEVGEWVEA